GTMRLAPDLTINIKQYLDRVDRVFPTDHYGDLTKGTIRIIDYKTGVDNIEFKSLDDLFAPTARDRRKAILQLMFYSRAYAEKFRYEGPVQPFIYRMRTIYSDGLNPLKYCGKPLKDYHEIIDGYMERLEALVREMLLSDKPFTQAEKEESCTFCLFKTLCRRR
ncbi:MAG: PD-(D/E)XK nuclease family protein, partial [Duncaniella sp.]|nr:PD-(D/E)XK nuclease family protein [Duncaniella sp.]